MDVTKDTIPASWWTPKRIQRVCFWGFLWNVVFAVLVITFNLLDVGELYEAHSAQDWYIWLVHPIAYVLMIGVLLAVHHRHGAEYGRLGTVAIHIEVLLLAVLAIFGTLGTLTFEVPSYEAISDVFDILTIIGFIFGHLVPTAIGIVLWRRTSVRRLGAGLLILTGIMVPGAGILDAVGLFISAAGFEVPLALGIAVLGYELWQESVSTDAS